MNKLLALSGIAVLAAASGAVSYTNDFEGEGLGTLPSGWEVIGWGDWAPGPFTAEVAAAPGGGQALKMVLGTDWGSYGASSGEAHFTLDVTGLDMSQMTHHVSYDFYKENWRIWHAFGDNGGFPGAGFIHMNDDPTKPNYMVVGTDNYDTTSQLLTDVPEAGWIHVDSWHDMITGDWTTTVSYGGNDHTFSGNFAPTGLMGQYFFGGWAFQSTMDSGYGNGQGVYENSLYVDNFNVEVVPEPATLTALGLGAAMLLRRRKKA